MTPREALDELYKIAYDETVGTSLHQEIQDAFAVLQKSIEPDPGTNYEKLFSSPEKAAETLCNSSMTGWTGVGCRFCSHNKDKTRCVAPCETGVIEFLKREVK